MERFFKLKENGTTIKTEIIAGLTTFFTMAYIIFVNPAILGSAGMDKNAVMLATCLAAALGTILIGVLANYPFAQAPGMGLNAFFAFTICGTMGMTWQQGLAAVFISGIAFILITVSGLRTQIVNAIPASIKKAIGAGIGLFIAYIGFKNANLLHFTVEGSHIVTNSGFVVKNFTQEAGRITDGMANSIASMETTGGIVPSINLGNPVAILALIGLVIMIALMAWKVKGALFIGIIATSAIGLCAMEFGQIEGLGITIPQSFSLNFNLSETFLKMDFQGLLGQGGFITGLASLLTVLISLTMVDMFDTVGTLIGTASKANLLDENGNLPRANKALLADAIATSAGACLGTSTITTYVESGAGIAEGGRTGLTSVVVAVCFVLAIFVSPVLGLIPAAATAPALIIVGVLMIGTVKDIAWDDFETAVPAFLTMAGMPFAYSIADGIALGFISFTLIKIFRGKFREVHPITYTVSALFIIRYILLVVQF